MHERIKKVMSELWSLSPQEIPDDASANAMTEWDSIAHLQLMLALEMEFDIQFPSGVMMNLLTLRDIENHLVALSATA
jgi:acyl carrier protein